MALGMATHSTLELDATQKAPATALATCLRVDTGAADLLGQGQTINDVAGLLGYSNGSHFAAAFRRYNGANPSEWRRFQKAVNVDELP